MAIIRPRMHVRLYVPNVGTAQERVQQEQEDDVTQLDCRCYKAILESNSHNEADSCEVHIAYDDAGIDPRFLRNAEIYFWLGEADDRGRFQPTAANLRFIGIADTIKRSLGKNGKRISIKALDYTTLFLNHNGFPPAGVPLYSDTLATAWARICDHTGYYDLASRSIVSTVQRLRDRIEFVGPDNLQTLTLGKAVSPRLAKLGCLQVPHGSDAWGVWQTAVGSLGLISFIRGDRVIVTTATDYYSANDPPRFVHARNVVDIEEARDQHKLSGKNVGLYSFDPLTGKNMEAYYPPLGDVTPKGRSKKKIGASALGPGVVVRAQDYEIFQYPYPVTDQATLDFCAQRVWEERSRQELRGTLKTGKMSIATASAADAANRTGREPTPNFDVVGLLAGDRIQVHIDQQELTLIQRSPTLQARQNALRQRGYSAQMAQYITRNLSSIASLGADFQVHRVTTELDFEDDPGEFEITVEYLNRIDPSGSAQPGTGTATAATSGGKKP